MSQIKTVCHKLKTVQPDAELTAFEAIAADIDHLHDHIKVQDEAHSVTLGLLRSIKEDLITVKSLLSALAPDEAEWLTSEDEEEEEEEDEPEDLIPEEDNGKDTFARKGFASVRYAKIAKMES